MKSIRCLTVLLALLLSATLVPVPAMESAAPEIPTVVYSGKSYYRYTVKPKETIYSLGKRFGVDENELIANNPFLKKGLKAGQLLLIPVKDGVTVEQASASLENVSAEQAENQSKPSEPPLTPVVAEINGAAGHGHVTSFALLLPLLLDDTTDVSNLRYVEYYEGMLLAADTLRHCGISVDITVHDIGKTLYSMNKVLSRNRFNDVDYIIAAANNTQLPELSRWAMLHRKHLILPFSSRIPETAANPYIYQVNPPREMSYKHLLAMDVESLKDKNILLLRTPNEDKDERQQLFAGFKSRLDKYGIQYKELTDAGLKADEGEDYQDVLEPALSGDMVNLVVPAPVSLTESNRIISLVGAAANMVENCTVMLFGYPEWIALNKSNLPLLYRMHAQIYGNYFVDFTAPDVRSFEVLYSQTFGKDEMNTFPRYGMMGYDIAIYFTGRHLNFDSGIAPLQHKMHFVQPSADGGWYNDNVYLIQFHPDRTVSAEVISE